MEPKLFKTPIIPANIDDTNRAGASIFQAAEDHTHSGIAYALLAGRSGSANDITLSTTTGGTLAGSSASGQNLILKPTTHATPGNINAAFCKQMSIGIIPMEIGGFAGDYPSISYNTTWVSNDTANYKASDTALRILLGDNSGADISFQLAASGTVGNPITFTKALAVSSGSLAITKASNGAGQARIHIEKSQAGTTTLGNARQIILANNSGGLNELLEIGFGFKHLNTLTYQPVVIGHKVTANSNLTKGTFYIATRDVETDTAPTERLTVTARGNTLIGNPTEPTTGDAGLILNAGTALATMGSGSAGIYAKTVSGVTHLIAIASDGTEVQVV